MEARQQRFAKYNPREHSVRFVLHFRVQVQLVLSTSIFSNVAGGDLVESKAGKQQLKEICFSSDK